MDDRRKKLILIIAVVLVVVGVIALLVRSKRTAEAPAPAAAGAPSAASAGTLARSGGIASAPTPEEVVTPPPPPSTAVAVKQLAMTFAERYGSFSSEGNYVNIEDLYPLMTERYQRRSEAEIARQRAAEPSAEFQSTTSVVIGAVVDLPNGEESREATVRVSTQRTAVKASAAPRTYGQELTVRALRVGDEWLVDSATWGPAEG